jgi:hypothetical protein
MNTFQFKCRVAAGVALMVVFVLAAASAPPGTAADEAPYAGWEEVGPGSASGGGISQTEGMSVVPSLAIDPHGRPVIAWRERTPDNEEIYLRRWNGTTWEELGGSASGGGVSDTHGASDMPSLAIGRDGQPVVAWIEGYHPGSGNVYVRRWNGQNWEEVGAGSASLGGISGADRAGHPSLAVAPDGTLVVAWQQLLENSYEIYAKRWRGSAWEEMGGSASGGGISHDDIDSMVPSLAIGSDGLPVVAWEARMVADGIATNDEIYLRRWNGDAWVELDDSASGGGISNTSGYSTRPSLAVGLDNRPVVAWSDSTDHLYQICVRYWDGMSWVDVGPPLGDETSHDDYGTGSTSLAVGPDRVPVVAGEHTDSTRRFLVVWRWSGSAWAEVGSDSVDGTTNALWPSLAVAPNGRPVLAWYTWLHEVNEEIYVRQHAPILFPQAFMPVVGR